RRFSSLTLLPFAVDCGDRCLHAGIAAELAHRILHGRAAFPERVTAGELLRLLDDCPISRKDLSPRTVDATRRRVLRHDGGRIGVLRDVFGGVVGERSRSMARVAYRSREGYAVGCYWAVTVLAEISWIVGLVERVAGFGMDPLLLGGSGLLRRLRLAADRVGEDV